MTSCHFVMYLLPLSKLIWRYSNNCIGNKGTMHRSTLSRAGSLNFNSTRCTVSRASDFVIFPWIKDSTCIFVRNCGMNSFNLSTVTSKLVEKSQVKNKKFFYLKNKKKITDLKLLPTNLLFSKRDQSTIQTDDREQCYMVDPFLCSTDFWYAAK